MHLYKSESDPVAIAEREAHRQGKVGDKSQKRVWEVLELQERDFVRGKAANRLRKQGRIPVVVMGKQLEPGKPLNCSADLAHVTRLYRQHGHYHMLSLNFEVHVRPTEMGEKMMREAGATEAEVKAEVETYKTIVHDVEWDPMSGDPIQVFLMVIGPRQRTVARPVQLMAKNADQSRAKKAGCDLTWNQFYLNLLCKSDAVPRFVEVDVSKLRAGQTLFFDRLPLPPGVLGAAEPWKLKKSTPICRWRLPRVGKEEEGEGEGKAAT